MFSSGQSGRIRFTVLSSSEAASPGAMARSCFGFNLRDAGQKRVPLPPAMMRAYREFGEDIERLFPR
jgi:hypothetical protein